MVLNDLERKSRRESVNEYVVHGKDRLLELLVRLEIDDCEAYLFTFVGITPCVNARRQGPKLNGEQSQTQRQGHAEVFIRAPQRRCYTPIPRDFSSLRPKRSSGL